MKSLCVVAIIVSWMAEPQAECFPVWGLPIQPSKGAIPSCPICWLKMESGIPAKGSWARFSSTHWDCCDRLLGRGGNLSSSGCSLPKVGGVASSSPQPHLRIHHHLHRQLLQKRTHPPLIQKRGQKLPLMQ
ncbi:hypothetical protein ACVWZI_000984 [Thermostichus sp. OS-CIW-28]